MTAYDITHFDYVLDIDGVVGHSFHDGTLRLYCCDDCDEEQLIAAVSEDVDIETSCIGKHSDDGEYLDPYPETVAEPQTERQGSVRPVRSGVSEIKRDSTAATAGFYPATVVDTSTGVWGDDVTEGDIVRLSNHHVYAMANDLDTPIIQPGPVDGGSMPDDQTGNCVGYVPLEDGMVVDAAARDVGTVGEESTPFDLPEKYGERMYRGDYADLLGETMIKTGRTTGVTEGTLNDVDATFKVNYGEPVGAITVRDNLVTGQMGAPGDSGSPMFHKATGEAVGKLYAGSPDITIFSKAQNIETELGVQIYAGSSRPTAEFEIRLRKTDNGNGDSPTEAGQIEVVATVADGQRRLPNATIDVRDPESGDIVASGSTDAGGEWTERVPVAAYEIHGAKDGHEPDSVTISEDDWEVR